MINKRLRAFTLVELLVVIVIIALLASILIPSLNKAKHQARTRQCAANLHNIGVAWAKSKADGALTNQDITFWLWTMQLMPALNNNPDALICPEDDKPVLAGLDGISVRVYPTDGGDPFDMDVFSNLDSYGHGDPTGQYTWRVNQEQYDYLKSLRGTLDNKDIREYMTDYTDDGSGVSYLLFEDLRGDRSPDWDFWDCQMKIEQTGDNSFKYSAMKLEAGFSFKLVGPDGKESDTFLNNKTPMDGEAAGMPTSYGVTNVMNKLATGASKVLGLDYRRALVNVVGDDALPGEFDEFIAPRHSNKSNVLYASGTVDLLSPTAIDPTQPYLDQLWTP